MARSGKVWPGEVAMVFALNGGTVNTAHVRLRNEFPVGPSTEPVVLAGLSLS